MRSIQIINYSREETKGRITYSKLAAPRSLDEFDLNIIDLSDNDLWYCNGISANGFTLLSQNDLISLNTMIQHSQRSIILFVLPQDISLYCITSTTVLRGGEKRHQYEEKRIKDIMPALRKSVFSVFSPLVSFFEISYENTKTLINSVSYNAAFYYSGFTDGITTSVGSQKTTTIRYDDRFVFTTLDVLSTEEHLFTFISSVLESAQRQQIPDWMACVRFNDDAEQESVIEKQKCIIQTAESAIEAAKAKLETNQRYKSILYTNGEELVEVVFDILQILLECDLSQFVDEKKEDFLVHTPAYTLIGEIKGITSNVKNEHISQLEIHYQQYLDQLEEKGTTENVHQLLIINPLRNKPVSECEPVHENQIALAARNGSLIIETVTLLRLFELFLQNKVTAEKCIRLFTERVGILKPSDFE